MIAASAIPARTATEVSPIAHVKNGKVSFQTFLEKYSRLEDGYKYEYEDGEIIKSDKTISEIQAHIAHNLSVLFFSLYLSGKVKGSLQTEMDWRRMMPRKFRRPDLCYLPEDQAWAASQGELHNV